MGSCVFLHIGPPKSGSTYLQSRMWANRRELSDCGIYLPGDGPVDHFHAGADLRELPIRGEAPRPAGAWERLSAQVRESDARAVVISDERLGQASSTQAATAARSLAPHDLHVIYSVREFSGLLPSEWQEGIKQAVSEPFDDWLTRVSSRGRHWFWKAHTLGNVFARWNLPQDHVHLLVVPSTGSDRGELWSRFASIIGAPAALPHESPRRNESLGLDETELVRRMYGHLGGSPPPTRVYRVMREIVSRQLLQPRESAQTILLPESCRPWVDHHTMRRKKFVASSGCLIVGTLDELDVDPTRFVPDPSRPEDARVLDVALDVVGELATRIIRQWRRRESPPGVPAAPRVTVTNSESAPLVRRPRSAIRGIGRRTRVAIANRVGRSYYLHIGPPETGSRTLQRSLWASRAPLEADGVYVSGASPPDHDAAVARALHPVDGQASARLTAAWERLVSDAERSGHRKIVITNDWFGSARAEDVARLLHRLDGADIHIIYVLRDLATLLPAVWQRQALLYPTAPWHEWMVRLADNDPSVRLVWHPHEVENVLNRWCAAGAARVHLLVFPRSGDPTLLWQRFQSIVGWREPTPVQGNAPHRIVDPAEGEVLRLTRQRIADRRPRHGLARVTEDVLLGGTGTPVGADCGFHFPEGARRWVEARSAARLACVADRRYEVVGDAHDLDLAACNFTAEAPVPSDSATLQAAARIAARLVDELSVLRWQ